MSRTVNPSETTLPTHKSVAHVTIQLPDLSRPPLRIETALPDHQRERALKEKTALFTLHFFKWTYKLTRHKSAV